MVEHRHLACPVGVERRHLLGGLHHHPVSDVQ